YLLDSGASDKFLINTKALKIDVKEIDYAILSHAHYDHAGGMGAFFDHNDKASFYLRSGSRENSYLKIAFLKKYIGLEHGILQRSQDRIIMAEGDYVIEPGVFLIPHKTEGLEKIGRKAFLYVNSEGQYKPDNFNHEQSLVFDTAQGLVILNSCSHGGADTIIREIQETFPEKQVYALIGGFHLIKQSSKEVRKLAIKLKESGVKHIYTGHCTGDKAFKILKEELQDRVDYLSTGLEIVID
ncbi:MAG: beta-lactamase domain protein, partial [Herbinix sp.]|nr:beta-lactamase domain protein [Herbinix sp.]